MYMKLLRFLGETDRCLYEETEDELACQVSRGKPSDQRKIKNLFDDRASLRKYMLGKCAEL